MEKETPACPPSPFSLKKWRANISSIFPREMEESSSPPSHAGNWRGEREIHHLLPKRTRPIHHPLQGLAPGKQTLLRMKKDLPSPFLEVDDEWKEMMEMIAFFLQGVAQYYLLKGGEGFHHSLSEIREESQLSPASP